MVFDRYFLKLWLSPFLGFFLVITSVLLFGRMIRAIQEFGQNPIDWPILGSILWSIIPYFLTLTVPFAFFFALMRTMAYLQQNSETDALLAAGISPLRMLRPASAIAFLFAIFLLWTSMVWMPQGQKEVFALTTAIKHSSAMPSLTPQQFSEGFNDLTMYYAGEDKQGRLKQFMLEDKRSLKPSIYLAQTAKIERHANFLMLNMYDGVHLEGEGELLRSTYFSTFSLSHDIGAVGVIGPIVIDNLKPGMMTTSELLTLMAKLSNIDVVAEWHRRLSFPLTIFILLLFAFPLASSSKRSGKSIGWVWGIALVLVLFNIQIILHKQVLLEQFYWWSIWLGQVGFLLFGGLLFRFYMRYGHAELFSLTKMNLFHKVK
ncbi:MAG: hypothetical protein AUK35_05610 [Zetaproteobacteria bacterium CG2_30_46_52]|nr:MAG: hypothetical protein AUK35_05610 [Zetaproteobacteria bacterium CG2_30_46_52]